MADLIRTIDDDDEHFDSEEDSDEEVKPVDGSKKKKKAVLNKISFDLPEEKHSYPWDFEHAKKASNLTHFGTTIDEKIKALLVSKGKGSVKMEEDENDVGSGKEDENEDSESEENSESESEDEIVKSDKKKKSKKIESEDEADEYDEEEDDSDDSDDEETRAKKEAANKYFRRPDKDSVHIFDTFVELNLSRPILKALSDINYTRPTPIQSQAIPIALQGTDICASAVTGSGKTASFLLPIVERLLYRDARIAAIRVLILLPTRELAVQCHSNLMKLAKYTDITMSLVVGGLNNKTQELELRNRPDVVVATPGRLIDHLRNSKSVTIDDVEILVLDEADRLLDMGFSDEIEEIVSFLGKNRQSMLFSATMTEEVEQLIKLSLNNPVRIAADAKGKVASGISQEFIRVRDKNTKFPTKADLVKREALLLSLCANTFKKRVLIFFSSKAQAHRMKIIMGLLGFNAGELHGNLTQNQRLEALESFRDGNVDFLLCTDLVARGLDILGIEVIINFQMPKQLAQYIHRVGRTARWGYIGTAVSMIGENDRKLLKKIIKHKRAEEKMKSRDVDREDVENWRKQIGETEYDCLDLIQKEKEEKELRIAQMEANKAKHMIENEDEIFSRPAKTWFQSQKKKNEMKDKMALDMYGDKDPAETGKAKGKGTKRKRGEEETEETDQPEKPAIRRDIYAGMSRKQRRRKEFLAEVEKDEKDTQARQVKEEQDDKAALEKWGSENISQPKQKKKKKGVEIPSERQMIRSAKAAKSAARKKSLGISAPAKVSSASQGPEPKRQKTSGFDEELTRPSLGLKRGSGGAHQYKQPKQQALERGNRDKQEKKAYKKKGNKKFKSKRKFKRR